MAGHVFRDPFEDLETVIINGTQNELWFHVGIAQVLKAYTYSIFVDLWGNVPYEEASLGEINLNPFFDEGSSIYPKLFTLIDEGIANLEQSSDVTSPSNDLFYSSNIDLWIRAANTP